MTDEEASRIIEDVLDALIEFPNAGPEEVQDEMMSDALSKLFKFRDEWMRPTIEARAEAAK